MKRKMVNWPTYSDGTEVKLGDKVMSLRGPVKLTGVEIEKAGWTLRGHLTHDMCMDGEEPTFSYIIDQGEYGKWHPTRADQYCDFWPGTEREAVEYYGAEVVAKNTGRTVDDVWMDAANEGREDYVPYGDMDAQRPYMRRHGLQREYRKHRQNAAVKPVTQALAAFRGEND